jgi:hypothetical protein
MANKTEKSFSKLAARNGEIFNVQFLQLLFLKLIWYIKYHLWYLKYQATLEDSQLSFLLLPMYTSRWAHMC